MQTDVHNAAVTDENVMVLIQADERNSAVFFSASVQLAEDVLNHSQLPTACVSSHQSCISAGC